MEIKDILHKAPSKRLFLIGIHSFLRRADAKGSDDIITVLGLCRLLWCIWPGCGSENRSRIEYLIFFVGYVCIIVLD